MAQKSTQQPSLAALSRRLGSLLPQPKRESARRLGMDVVRVKIQDAKRGALTQGWDGWYVLDTLSATDDGVPFWYDTNGTRRAWKRDGYAYVAVAPFETQKVGSVRRGKRHIVLNNGKGACPASRNASLRIWESGTALASVTCASCRAMYDIVGSYER